MFVSTGTSFVVTSTEAQLDSMKITQIAAVCIWIGDIRCPLFLLRSIDNNRDAHKRG
ncbi:hypothetical protein CBM2633_P30014 [Cupriavidus taiwanensis]|uniref:Uncharacterized protein n=2 Tax=Cupriavidus TaxID=106589 RepID=A0A375F828_9BURK|nr:hypothetical protein CBM2592_P30013 [Cupriavidus taiwanensis]SOZ40584.1 hypothetical protein CBM2605_P30014 [Cupriavidus neocaledonicus]SOY75433.1 hypothetical protein CBM2588_P30013 [Cupriavidus taiwanensis]SOY75752.1 hypothetical protein CBM2585_P30014 [Cupriavidus taiwanensis]SOY77880.1 hypothetical protein CBM2586_P30012 [Cupriavidus taiwanensis]